jgi:hypothetical protein
MRALPVCLLLGSMLLSACSSDGARHTSAIQPSVRGGLTTAQIQAGFERNMPQIEELAGGNWPGAGRMQVSFVVQPDGLPGSIELVRNDFQNPQLEVALTRLVESIAFPPAKSPTFVKGYPVYFQ